MRTDFETLKLDYPAPGVLLLTLNRPEVRNALNTRMGVELREIFVPFLVSISSLGLPVFTTNRYEPPSNTGSTYASLPFIFDRMKDVFRD